MKFKIPFVPLNPPTDFFLFENKHQNAEIRTSLYFLFYFLLYIFFSSTLCYPKWEVEKKAKNKENSSDRKFNRDVYA